MKYWTVSVVGLRALSSACSYASSSSSCAAMRPPILITPLLLMLATLFSLVLSASEPSVADPQFFVANCSLIAPTSFCKCTCDRNSTIIPLDAPASRPSHPALLLRSPENDQPEDGKSDGEEKKKEEEEGGGKDEGHDRKEYRPGNCNDCNKQFCLSYNLPICKDVDVEKVFTTCFREFGLSY